MMFSFGYAAFGATPRRLTTNIGTDVSPYKILIQAISLCHSEKWQLSYQGQLSDCCNFRP
jgi:hypothetical protein